MGQGEHAVAVGPGGAFAKDADAGTTPVDIDAIAERLRGSSVEKVVLHFHGGLVPAARGFELAGRLELLYSDAGAYPLTVVWETGLLETVSRNLATLNQTKLFNRLLDLGISQLAKAVGAGSKGAGTRMSLEEVRAARASDEEMEAMDARARGGASALTEAEVEAARGEIELELQLELESDPELDELTETDEVSRDLLDAGVAEQLGEAKGAFTVVALAKMIAGVVINGARRFVAGRDHGVIPTAVEELLRAAYLANAGAWVWSGMKTSAEAMWRDNGATDDEPEYVGSYLLARLAELQAQRPDRLSTSSATVLDRS